MTDLIIIHKEKQCYSVEFLGPCSERVFAAFGTRVIPTPFTLQARVRTVLEDIKQRYTDVDVCLTPVLLDQMESEGAS